MGKKIIVLNGSPAELIREFTKGRKVHFLGWYEYKRL